MKQFSYIITDELGIHARPAGLFVKEAKQFESVVQIEAKGKKVPAKGLIGIMSLGVKCGDEVAVYVEGADEEQAATVLEAFFRSNL